MAIWAYPCRPCAGEGEWFVAQAQVDSMHADVRLLRVKVGADWCCAAVDRARPVAVEASLLRQAVASDEQDCPECAPPVVRAVPAAADEAAATAATVEPEAAPAARVKSAAATQVQAAAIALQGHRFLVVLTALDVVRSPGEADMLIADLRPHFGPVDIVLMGQQDDGTPEYHGPAPLVGLLADLPIDRMPWKTYPIG
jgi:hypothetical protein